MHIAIATNISHEVSFELTSLGRAQAGWLVMEAFSWFSTHHGGKRSIGFEVMVFTSRRTYDLESSLIAINLPEGNFSLPFGLLHSSWFGSNEEGPGQLVEEIKENEEHFSFFLIFGWFTKTYYLPPLCTLLEIPLPEEFPDTREAGLILIDTEAKSAEFKACPFKGPA